MAMVTDPNYEGLEGFPLHTTFLHALPHCKYDPLLRTLSVENPKSSYSLSMIVLLSHPPRVPHPSGKRTNMGSLQNKWLSSCNSSLQV